MEPLAAILSTVRNGTYTVTIKRAKEFRSLPQNDLMWLWLKCIEDDTHTPKKDIYKYYCKKFLSRYTTINGQSVQVYDTSSELTTEQMSRFMDCIQADALTELGINLPNPQDKYFESFYDEFNGR